MPVGSLEKQIKDINKSLSVFEDVLSVFYIARGIVINAPSCEAVKTRPLFICLVKSFLTDIHATLSAFKSSHNLLQKNVDVRLFGTTTQNVRTIEYIDLTYDYKYARYLSISFPKCS